MLVSHFLEQLDTVEVMPPGEKRIRGKEHPSAAFTILDFGSGACLCAKSEEEGEDQNLIDSHGGWVPLK